jgi:hypothetical protein
MEDDDIDKRTEKGQPHLRKSHVAVVHVWSKVYSQDLGRPFYFQALLCIFFSLSSVSREFCSPSPFLPCWSSSGREMRGAGVKRARLFSCERAACEMLEVFRGLG